MRPAFLITLLTFGHYDCATADDSTRIELSSTVASFAHMDSITSFDQLPQYGLLPPGASNHEAGTNLVKLALSTTSYRKGAWAKAIGLLGVTMLDIDVPADVAYRSLFSSIGYRSKLHACSEQDDNIMMRDTMLDVEARPVQSREVAVCGIATGIKHRFIYNSDGNFAREYSSNRSRVGSLTGVIKRAHATLVALKYLGYEDGTLRDALGMAVAVHELDGGHTDLEVPLSIGPIQIYRDALEETLRQMKRNPAHNWNFLKQLGWAMQSRGLATEDQILLPVLDEAGIRNFQGILSQEQQGSRYPAQ